ncbi:MAG: hypothetical protein HHJ11_01200 [Phycicoccus sp.]|nr:hypothetical protein [Phycicoccus sp.]
MTNNTTDRLVDDYLARLADAAQGLPLDRRAELLSEIQEHIVAARAGGAGTDEAAVRTMLDRLGEPADIVAAAVEDDPPEQPAYVGPPQVHRQGLGLEIAAVVMLTLGSLIPVVGWAVGVILLWSSRLWRPSEKLLGTLIVPGGPGLALLLGGAVFALPTQTCSSTASSSVSGGPVVTTPEVCTGFALSPLLGIAVMLFVLAAPIVVAIVLLNRARGRVALEES